ncbi:M28 family peptidase [Hyalangium versicolor]|uniref:M28 family peptidase n=1 Tax=Hyalangium versicolor TaxID=2861190 RepID=UPI001CCCAA8C|nr:M28 family peptidase [Hyalangium versicolor]
MATRINEKIQGVSSQREPVQALNNRVAGSAPGRAGPDARLLLKSADGFEGASSTPQTARPRVALDGAPPAAPLPRAATPTAGAPISQSVTPRAPIEDNKTVTSTLALTGDATVDSLKLNLDITHPYRGDLVVSLTSPSGKSAVISNKEGGSADNIQGTFDLSAFAGEKAAGTWTLKVQDTSAQDTGTLNSWGLTVTPKGEQPPPPQPAGDDSDPMKHITYLASDELKGRDSPSEGLSAASAYAEQLAKKYGLVGPNTQNPADPYQQKFQVFSFAGAPSEGSHGAAAAAGHEHKNFGNEVFDEGFYLDKDMPAETRELLTQRYEETMKATGRPLAPRSGPMSVDQLREVAQVDGMAQNTMAMLPGTGPHKDEVIVVMAHLDHIGTGRGGVVNNGADDNASGSAVLMSSIPELAEAQKRGELDRSVLFLWTGAEEKGLVGSQYFVDHPIPGLGLKNIAGVVNMDMVGRWDDQRLSVIDTNSKGQATYFREVVNKANEQLADPFDRLNQDINQYRDRQDGAVFTRKGEDVLFLFEGLSNPNGGGDLIPEYHSPTDDIDKIVRDNGGNKPRRVKDLMVNVIKLASNRQTVGA